MANTRQELKLQLVSVAVPVSVPVSVPVGIVYLWNTCLSNAYRNRLDKSISLTDFY